MAAPRPINEAARLAALRRYDVMGGADGAAFDALTELAARVAGTPIAYISLVDDARQCFKATYNFGGRTELPRDAGFCTHAILQNEIFEIHDAAEDGRFSGDPLVTGEPYVRFYAGVPLVTHDGYAIGALCVLDTLPGWLSAEQRTELELLAKSIVALIEARERAPDSDRDQSAVLAAAFEDAADMMVVTDNRVPPDGWPVILSVNKEFERLLGYSREEAIGKTTQLFFGAETDPETIGNIAHALQAKEASRQEFVAYRKDGTNFLMETHSRAVFDRNGKYVNRVIVARDVTENRTAELELHTLRALIDEATDFIFTTDATPTWLGGPFFTYVNNSMLRATGYNAEDLEGKSPTTLYGADTDRAVVRGLIEHIDRAEPCGYEFIIYRKDGTPFWAEFNGRPIKDAAGNPLNWVAVGRDITSRRQTQQQLAVLSTAIESANDCIVVYEVDPHRDNAFRVVFVNDATVRESGFSREELMSGPTGSGPETDPESVAEFRQTLKAGEAARARLRLYRKDGSKYWGEISAQPIKNARGEITHIVSIERDVSDMVLREEQLRSDNETLSSLMQISRELFGVLSSESLRTTFLSGIEALTGIKPVEHVGLLATADPFLQRASASRVPVVDRSRGRAAFAVAGSSDAPPAVVEINAAAHNKRLERNIILALQLLVQNYRTAAQNTALYEEIEDRRTAVIELNQTKSDLIAMLAHDFRGPLTSIMGFSEVLREEHLPRREQEEYLDTIISATQRLSSLANDTLAMSNLEENELSLSVEPVDYVALANKAAEMYEDKREIEIVAQPEQIEGIADRARMRQVFDNLIGNAVKYSPGGRPVRVELTKTGEDDIQIRITDSGIGIPSGEIDRIFTRFSRASNARASGISGTGFGLYLARQIVERHGGTIEVESVLGKGSTFVVRVPAVSGAPVQPLRILLGDHAGPVRSFTAHTLRSNGYGVKVVDSVRDVDSELAAQSYDLAVIDVETFRANGATIQRLLDTANAASVPVIVIGTRRMEQLEGAAATLSKPYLAADLLSTVQRLDSRVHRVIHDTAEYHPVRPK